jgi:hypothetical protein
MRDETRKLVGMALIPFGSQPQAIRKIQSTHNALWGDPAYGAAKQLADNAQNELFKLTDGIIALITAAFHLCKQHIPDRPSRAGSRYHPQHRPKSAPGCRWMETTCPLSRVATILPYGAVRTFSGVGLGSATMHSECAERAAPNSAKPRKAKIILRMGFKFLF